MSYKQPHKHFNNKVSRDAVNGPSYSNSDVRHELRIPDVATQVKRFTAKHKAKINQHSMLRQFKYSDTKTEKG